MIYIGQKAPGFSLQGVFKEKIENYSFKNFKGKWLILFFYPKDFTFICPTEVKGFNQFAPEFRKAGGEVAGLSVDSVESHREWVNELGGIDYPLLSDPEGKLAGAFGVWNASERVANRATFIIHPDLTIQYAVSYHVNVGRSVEETLRVLKALRTERLCPVDWKPGDETLDANLKY